MVQIVQRKLMWKKKKCTPSKRWSIKEGLKEETWSEQAFKGMLGLDNLGGGTISRE